ncbi:iron complex outermembrane receptor protein [Sphingomonas naasensis]|uniref:TonB-dependent receptor n=1 Tax=Sphingomonas naasensis TaxID=1344951 RepID=A0A4S1WWE7_9SPHN|nr:TonB-dependent receptor [Sphingomonas naasensis]NIJ18642.1 iron complex outermembrane receptor protein [Sphingomonas naasensis]TGX45886.1 TonB-dependent receptor [Sphingomonas naasensis]
MSKSVRALLGVPLLLAALPAFAQEAAERSDDVVVTAEKLVEQAIQRVGETPGGANVVSAEEFDGKLAVSLRDALAFSPGVYAQPRFGQEVRLSIRGSGIGRGFHMRGLTLLQDGIPINLADDNGDFQELDPAFLQHLEVFRGANALRFGASTLGGAINGVTPTGRSSNGVRLRIDGGSFDTLRGLASIGYADARGDAWLAIAGDRSDGDRDHARRKALRVNGNVGLRLSDTVETRFYASAQSIRQELPGALTYAVARSAPETGNFAGDQARDIDSLRLQNRTSIAIGAGNLDVGLFLNAKQLHHPIYQLIDQKSLDWGSYARLDQDFGTFGVTAGVTARFGSVASRRFVNINGAQGAKTFAADQAARTIDAYAEARIRPVERLTLIAGAVYTSGLRRQDQVFPTIANGRATFDQLSPKLGLLFEPDSRIQLYANLSRSHELPGFIELAQISDFVPLDAQRGWTAEIGGRGRIGPLRFDLSAYRADLDGELLQYNIVPPTIPAATFNAGRTRHQGVELGIDLDLAAWARLRQTYMWSDFHFRGDAQFGDNRLPVIPEHFYRAELRLGSDALHVSPNVEWVPRGAWVDYANSFRTDGYALLGLGAEARLDRRFTLFADARNLAGRKAAGDISAVVQYTPASAIFYPVERRSLFAGVRAAF